MAMVRRLDRYILAEILGPMGLGLLVYTFILLLNFLFRSAEMIIRRGLPVSVVSQLLGLTLPNIVVLTIPMAFLFGILIAVGRLASDTELTAMRASGISLMSLYRPILFLSLILTVINTLLMVYVLPWGNHSLQRLHLEILSRSVSQQLEPRVFYEEWEGKVVYVFEVPPGQQGWRGVFLAEALPLTENEITVAEWGEAQVDEETDQVVLRLSGALTHRVNLASPGRYEITRHRRLEKVMEDQFLSSQQAKIVATKGVRELTLPELRAWTRDASLSQELRSLAWVEIHKKFSIPAACLVFGLLGLPLGFINRRGGKASGFALSIGVILIYYILLSNGEEAARVGKMPPWLAMWSPNLLLAAAGALLLRRRNWDRGLLPSRLDRWIRQDLWRWIRSFRVRPRLRSPALRRRRRPAQANIVLRIPRLRLLFPNVMDRYVLRLFAWVLLLTLASGIAVYVVADLTEKVDDILRNDVPRQVVVDYYKYLSLQILYDIAPVVVLVTTLITFSLLSRTNEIIACKAVGMSLYRLSVPAVAAAALVALLCALLESEVLPASNQRVAQLHDRIKGRETARTYRRADRQWLVGHGRYIYNYLHYDPQTQTLHRLQIFEFDHNHRLIWRLAAASARYVGGAWVFTDSWTRSFHGVEETSYRRYPEPRLVRFPETPESFESEIKPPEQMRYRELKTYIEELQARGQVVPDLAVELYSKISFPFVCLVMALVALPFAFRLGRHGALYGIGLSLVLGMVFMGVYAFFATLGQTGALPPLAAVWSPNLLFAMLAVYLFLGVRT